MAALAPPFSPTASPATSDPLRTWPVTAVTIGVGAFIVLALGGVGWKVLSGGTFSETDAVIILACVLRGVTIANAQAAVRPWGRVIPGWIVLGGLWGAAALQVVYPLAEFVLKTLVMTGVMEQTSLGATHTSAISWFNFAMTTLIWGVPGALLAITARDYRRRTGTRLVWVVLGVPGGIAFLGLLGWVIG